MNPMIRLHHGNLSIKGTPFPKRSSHLSAVIYPNLISIDKFLESRIQSSRRPTHRISLKDRERIVKVIMRGLVMDG